MYLNLFKKSIMIKRMNLKLVIWRSGTKCHYSPVLITDIPNASISSIDKTKDI